VCVCLILCVYVSLSCLQSVCSHFNLTQFSFLVISQGNFTGRSVLASSPLQGSLLASSAYMYTSSSKCAARDNAAWQAQLLSDPIVPLILDNLAVMDVDFQHMFALYNITVFYYLSTQVFFL
jgi:hypothetical protein